MRIAMFTNLYLPKVGGVAISVDRFSRGYRRRGHEVLIVAPDFPGQPQEEEGVIRVHAIQDFNGSGFSLALPSGLEISRRLDAFAPELILISAGFDAHRRDPLAHQSLDEADFAWATRAVVEVARKHGGGKVVSSLEGGYDLTGLGRSAVAHVQALQED